MKEQILRNLIRESIKKMISESTLKEYSGDSGLEELVEVLGYADLIDFFEDNQGAVEAVYKWVESIPALRQQMKQSGMFESKLNEAEQTVKSEAASRLADFFRVPVHTLDKFNFDGNDNIQALSAALNSTSTQGTEMYYKMAIQLAKEELGVTESTLKEDAPGEKYVVYTYRKGKEDKKELFQKNNTLAYAKQLVNRNNRDPEESDIWAFMKQSEWTQNEAVKSTNVIETKIKEAGGRRFIKSEDIRQHNMSKIKEANKKK